MFAIYRADDHGISHRVEECFVGCGCVTSYDAECMAMAMAIAHAKAYMENQLPLLLVLRDYITIVLITGSVYGQDFACIRLP